MTTEDENALLERVFLRIGMADTDEQLQTALGKFLVPVLNKLNSPAEVVRKKVMELLVHINKRLKSRPKIQLPIEALIEQYKDPSASVMIMNFSIIYIKMGYPRLDTDKKAELVPQLIHCIEGKARAQQASLLQLVIPAFEHIKMPSNAAARCSKFGLSDTPTLSTLVLDYMLNILLLPYSSHATAIERAAQSGRARGTAPPPAPAPPGLSDQSFKEVTGDNPLTPEDLEKAKLGVLKFLGADIFKEEEVVCHYVIAAADTRHSVATAADMELKRITGTVDWNNMAILSRLYGIFQGTMGVKGKPVVKPEEKRMPACRRIRLKIFPLFLKSREATNIFPACLQVVFDCLYGQNTNAKLKNMAVQFVHHVCFSSAANKFNPISPVLLSGMVKLINEEKEDARLRSLAYAAIGKIVRRAPETVGKDIALVQKLFDSVGVEDSETRLAVQEALSMMAEAFSNLDESNMKLMEALILQNIDKAEPQARMMAVQYASTVFPPTNTASRYVLLLATGDVKEDIRIEALKALNSKTSSTTGAGQVAKNKFPPFVEMTWYIKEKGDSRVKSQNRYVSGNHTIPFNPVTYGQILLYLRSCLASSAGVVTDDVSVSEMQLQAPDICKYVRGTAMQGDLQQQTLQLYVEFSKQLLTASGGTPAIYCLLEMVAMAVDRLAPQFIQQLDWIKSMVFSTKDEIRDYASQLYAIVLHHHRDSDQIVTAVEEFTKNIPHKIQEKQNGSTLALGYIIGQLLGDAEHYRTMPDKSKEVILEAIKKIAWTLTSVEEPIPLLSSGACMALGEIGRRAALPLPPGGEDDNKEEVTKLSLVKTLLNIVRSGREIIKTKERAALCLGNLCVGEAEFPHRRKVIGDLMEAVQAKQVELQFTISEALVHAVQGVMSSAKRDLWTEPEEFQESDVAEMQWYVGVLLEKYVQHSNPHLRQAACIWLLALVKRCSAHQSLQSRLEDIQQAFMKLLSESDEITQDIASKGLGMVYEKCSTEQKDSLVSNLVDTLMTGKRSKIDVTGDTEVFKEGAIGKTPEGGGLTTYRELCSIANDLNQPDLIYKFMHLANHNAMWNSKKGAAFGFSTIAAQAGEQLVPYLAQIVPRLFRYQFDPNPRIQQAMSSIWNALVQNNKDTVDKYLKEIMEDVLKNLTSPQWRIRESSCLALNDLLRGRQLDDVIDQLPLLWESCLRVRDDIKESVRNAADIACRSLSRASIKICDINYGKVGKRATSLVLPCLLKNSLQSQVAEVRAVGLSTILKISKNAGSLLKPHIPVLVTALLEAVSGLEPQVMNYLSLHSASSQAAQEKLDSARIAASKMSPMMETVNLCVQYVDESVLPELVSRLTELIKSGIGVGTKAGCSSFVVSLVHQCPKDLTPHAGKLMSAFLSGLNDRNGSVRKSYSSALGHLVRVAKDSSVEKLITRTRTWYLEKEEESVRQACGQTLFAMSQQSPDVLKRHAAQALPLAFFAMHEKKDESSSKSDDILSVWEEVWIDSTPGTEAGIKLYLAEIVQLLRECLESQSWTTKAQAAAAMSTVASKLGSNLGPPHLGNLLTALLTGLQGRTWTGKECLLQATQEVCTSCKDSFGETSGGDSQPTILQVVDAIMRECRKEKLEYKMKAMECMADVLETHSIDRFQELWEILHPMISQEKKDDNEDEIKPQQRQNQLECYFAVLGKVWPKAASTQELFQEKFCSLLATTLPTAPWKIQVVILKSTKTFLERLYVLEDKEKFDVHEEDTLRIIEKSLASVFPCLVNMKYTVIREEALSVIDLTVNKIFGLGRIDSISAETRDRLVKELSSLESDSSPKLKDMSLDLRRTLTASMETS